MDAAQYAEQAYLDFSAGNDALDEARRELIILAKYIHGINTQPNWRDLQVGCPVCHRWTWDTNQDNPEKDIEHADTCVQSEALEIVEALTELCKES